MRNNGLEEISRQIEKLLPNCALPLLILAEANKDPTGARFHAKVIHKILPNQIAYYLQKRSNNLYVEFRVPPYIQPSSMKTLISIYSFHSEPKKSTRDFYLDLRLSNKSGKLSP